MMSFSGTSYAHCKSCDYFLSSTDFWEGSGDLCSACANRKWQGRGNGKKDNTHVTVQVCDFMKKEVVEAIVAREVERRSDQFGKERVKLNVNERLNEARAEKAALQAELEQVYSQDPKLRS